MGERNHKTYPLPVDPHERLLTLNSRRSTYSAKSIVRRLDMPDDIAQRHREWSGKWLAQFDELMRTPFTEQDCIFK